MSKCMRCSIGGRNPCCAIKARTALLSRCIPPIRNGLSLSVAGFLHSSRANSLRHDPIAMERCTSDQPLTKAHYGSFCPGKVGCVSGFRTSYTRIVLISDTARVWAVGMLGVCGMAVKTYTFGKFEVIRKLGQGGMGAVYEARLQGPGGFRKTVALKVISAEGAEIDDLAREATLGGLMQHPNLVDIYEYGDVDGVAYIAMEFVDGPTLSQLLRMGPVSPDAVVQLAMQVATGLSHAHGVTVRDGTVGLVHRDLKPANVLISRFGVVKIADFGIAQAVDSESDRVTGTPGYMSPEQWHSNAVNTSSDLWSLGSIMYRAITGRALAKRGVDLFRLRTRVTRGEIAREIDDVMPGLGPVVQSCVEFEPENRPSRAGEVKRALAAVPRIGSPDLGALLRKVLTDFAASQLVASPHTADTQSTGSHSRDFLLLPDGATEESATGRRYDNLRDDADSFHGREQELATLRDLFDGGARVVSICGPGGVGKSRLARHAARDLSAAFAGGVLHVDIEAHLGVDQLIKNLALAMGRSRRSHAIDVEQSLASGEALDRHVVVAVQQPRDALVVAEEIAQSPFVDLG